LRLYWKTTNVPQPDFWIIYNGNGDETLQRTDMTWNAQIRTFRTCICQVWLRNTHNYFKHGLVGNGITTKPSSKFTLHLVIIEWGMTKGLQSAKTSLSTTQYNQTYCNTQRRIANINKVTNHSIENTQLRTLDVESSQLQNLFAFHH